MNERNNDYPTSNTNGMSFICNRWVFTGAEGYRVQFDGTGADENGWAVFHYNAARTRLVERGLTEDEAHAMATRLAGPRVTL